MHPKKRPLSSGVFFLHALLFAFDFFDCFSLKFKTIIAPIKFDFGKSNSISNSIAFQLT